MGAASARTFSSLKRHRNYRLWFGGQLVSVTGTWMQNVAQSWFIVELTHSPVALGALALFQFGPYGLLGLLGGSIVDRFDKRRIIVATQAAQLMSAAVLAALVFTHSAQVWHVFVLAAFNGAVQVLDLPARQAFIIEMVGRDELPNAVALNVSIFNAARVIGPAIAGLIIAGVGVALCFAINAGSFLAVLSSLVMMRSEELFSVEREAQPSMLRSTREGLAYVVRTKAAWMVCGLILVISLFGINFNVLLPVLTSKTLEAGPQTFGLLSASFGLGALIGALVAAGRRSPTWRLLFGGAGVYSLLLLSLAPLHSVPFAAVTLGLTGIAFTTYTSMSNATLQLVVPDRLRGRVMGIYGYVFVGTAPLGGLLAGWLSDAGGTFLAFLVAGAVSLVAVLAAILVRGGLRLPRRSRPGLGSSSPVDGGIVRG